MKIGLYNFKLRKDIDRIKIFHYGHFSFVLLSIFLEMKYDLVGITMGMIKAGLFIFLYRLYYKTVELRYYTFWTFSAILAVHLLVSCIQGFVVHDLAGLGYCYLLALIFLLIQSYIFSSPFYFPRVRWWEYDFRYRYDVKVSISYDNQEFQGRLTDLRRGAGSVVLFEKLEVGEFFDLKVVDEEEHNITLRGEIMSRRTYSVGRGYTYGIKFHFSKDEEKDEFKKFLDMWKKVDRYKIRSEFQEFEKEDE